MLKKITLNSKNKTEFINITKGIKEIVMESGISNGIATIFTPHTTAAITINENADPDVVDDILKEINIIVPFEDNFKHYEGNSAAHIKSSIFGISETIILEDSKLLLGTWQDIYFCEFDGSRNRKVFVKIIGD